MKRVLTIAAVLIGLAALFYVGDKYIFGLASGWQPCDHCGSRNVEVTDSVKDVHWIRSYYKCRDCGNVWTFRHKNPNSDWW